MIGYEPVMVAMPLAKHISEFIMRKRRLPGREEIAGIMELLNLERKHAERDLCFYRGHFVVALCFSREKHLIIDVISSTGELSDALEVIAYRDEQLDSYIIEILPANELEFEGNIGIEPVIIDSETFELESTPVLGYFEEGEEGITFIIDRETYDRWKESERLDICPICGSDDLVWSGEMAYCPSCGFGIMIEGRKDEQAN